MEVLDQEQLQLIRKLEIFKIQGTDKTGRPILRIIGKLFPAVSVSALKKFLEDEIFPVLESRPFAVVYVHTGVRSSDDFPGISAFKSLYDAVPAKVRDNLEALYFLHPGLQSRIFLATFGRVLFSGLYGKVRYVSRLEFLWTEVRRKGVEIPDFVYEYDEEMMESRTIVDYGMESDHPRIIHQAPVFDCGVHTYSTRCIA
ncbi:uncharacterized protein LOC127257064 [Andrographis paniculata]|uniref:uncharacterized protein LOC127257064 n=1 Tax=Andrographis paniculata TaxID=175694 RepID=UPI0021E93B31|nr:uncharacterized protein LOC127257064 [Andrographis paniculata]